MYRLLASHFLYLEFPFPCPIYNIYAPTQREPDDVILHLVVLKWKMTILKTFFRKMDEEGFTKSLTVTFKIQKLKNRYVNLFFASAILNEIPSPMKMYGRWIDITNTKPDEAHLPMCIYCKSRGHAIFVLCKQKGNDQLYTAQMSTQKNSAGKYRTNYSKQGPEYRKTRNKKKNK